MTSAQCPSRRPTLWRRIRLSRVGITVALISFLVLSGTGAYAYWSVSTSLKMSDAVTAGTLAISTSWSSTADVEFTNESTYPKVMSFTVKNTTLNSTVSRAYDAVLSFSGATSGINPVKSNLPLTVWKTLNATDVCPTTTPTTNIVVGTWDSSPAIKVSGTLASPGAGDSQKWCVYSEVTDRSSLGASVGSVQLTPVVTATLKAGNWQGISTLGGPIQKTTGIFDSKSPAVVDMHMVASNGFCVDVSQAAAPALNVYVIQWTCGTQANQKWSSTTVAASGVDSQYLRFSPRLPTGKRLSGAGTAATVQASTTATSQQWQLQERSNGAFQLVNRVTGTCLTTPNNTIEARLILSSCNGSLSSQEFRFMPAPS